MKRTRFITVFAAVIICAVLLSSCDAPGVYLIDDQLPKLTDSATGYALVTSARITELSSGDIAELTEINDIERLRMNLEGIKCIRERDDEREPYAYTIEFLDGDKTVFEMKVCDDDDYIIDGYHYEAMYSGVDMFYLRSFFD